MIRGGSWNNNARNVRCGNRNNNHPDNRNNNLGFRLLSTGGAGCIRHGHGCGDRPSPRPEPASRIPPERRAGSKRKP